MNRSRLQALGPPKDKWVILVFCLTLLALFAMTPQFVAELDPPTGDEPFYLQMAMSLLHDGDVEMTNNYAQRDYLDFYPKDTASPSFRGWESFPEELTAHESATLRPGLYEKHGIGLPVLVAPAYLAGGRLGPVLFMSLLAALLAANIYLLAREFTGDVMASLVATLGLAFTSPLLPYSFLVFPAVPAALMSIYAFRRARLSPQNNSLQVAGVAVSLAALPWLHAGYLLLSFPLFAYFLARNWRGRRALAVLLPPLAVSGAAFLYYYYYLYGTFVPNYEDHAGFYLGLGTLQGMVGLFLDQQWGLVTYSPFYLVALAGVILIFQQRRAEVPWLLAAGLPTFMFFASYSQWWGEWCPPARYLVPILPFAAAPAALAVKEVGRLGKSLSAILLLVSLFLMGAFVLSPKLMYNHPFGESQLFLSLAMSWGPDLTWWLPSLVNPGAAVVYQAALAMSIAASLVVVLAGASVRSDGAAGLRPAQWFRRTGGSVVNSAKPVVRFVQAQLRDVSPRRARVLTAVALGLILAMGGYFRFAGLDWDAGQHLHPDERFVTIVATVTSLPTSLGQYFDTGSSPLNPANREWPNYAYGTSFLFLAKFLAGPTGMEGYDRVYLLGRALSALADLGTVALVFYLGRRLYGRWAGLLGAFVYAAAVLPIQYSHFFVAESFTTFFVVLTIFLAVRVSQGGGWADYLGMGAACGLALASKVSVALIILVMAVAAVLDSAQLIVRYQDRPPSAMRFPLRGGTRLIAGLGLSLAAAFLAFRLAQPYAFAGSSFLDIRPSLGFLESIETQRRMAEGSLEFPYTLQWAGTIRYLFPFQNFFWGLGPALTAAAVAGVGLALYQFVRERRLEHLLVLLWVALAFLYFGGQMVKYMRYFLPIYPFLALLAAYALVWLVRERGTRNEEQESRVENRESSPEGESGAEGRASLLGQPLGAAPTPEPLTLNPRPSLVPRSLFLVPFAVVLLGTFLWTWAFIGIYGRPVTRVEASRWIYQNLPAGASLAVEHWDDPLPLPIGGQDPELYQWTFLALYDDDNAAKVTTLAGQLAQVDYLILSSNRLYGSIPRLPLRYPMTSEYYRLLFSGDLGFQMVQSFTSYPSLGPLQFVDDWAEESFTVYDHPKVMIFKKSDSFSRERTLQLLSAVPLDNG